MVIAKSEVAEIHGRNSATDYQFPFFPARILKIAEPMEEKREIGSLSPNFLFRAFQETLSDHVDFVDRLRVVSPRRTVFGSVRVLHACPFSVQDLFIRSAECHA